MGAGPVHILEADVKGNCPACDAQRLNVFSWARALDTTSVRDTDPDRSSSYIASLLKPSRSLKYGELYECSRCHRAWYLNDDKLLMRRVPNPRRAVIEEWDANRLVPSAQAVEMLKQIGASGCDAYGNDLGEWKIPCSVRWEDGTIADPSIVVISKRPPLDEWRSRIAFFKNVAAIEPSVYALPRDVRVATYDAAEVSMGFSPTLVEHDRAGVFVLTGSVDVFSDGIIKGSDVRLAPPSIRYTREMRIPHRDPGEITYVYCDWFDGCENLAIPADWSPGRAWTRIKKTQPESGGIFTRLFGRRR